MMVGFIGVDLENLVNEVVLLVGCEGKSIVSYIDFEVVVFRTIAGIEKKRSLLIAGEKCMVLVYEVGYVFVVVVVGRLILDMECLEMLSIVS